MTFTFWTVKFSDRGYVICKFFYNETFLLTAVKPSILRGFRWLKWIEKNANRFYPHFVILWQEFNKIVYQAFGLINENGFPLHEDKNLKSNRNCLSFCCRQKNSHNRFLEVDRLAKLERKMCDIEYNCLAEYTMSTINELTHIRWTVNSQESLTR